jgi:mRNA interferase YafQ
MRGVRYTTRFKRDYKREMKGRFRDTISDELQAAVDLLAADTPLPDRFHDHALTGPWSDHRDCHIRPDLVLIYRKTEENGVLWLDLVRIGSHSELSL